MNRDLSLARREAASLAVEAYAAMQAGKVDQAVARYRLALSKWPNFPEVLNNLARALLSFGKANEAIALFRRAVLLTPDSAAIQSNLLTSLLYSPDITPETICAEHCRWGLQFGERSRARKIHGPRGTRLRLGYLSSNFRFNPEVFFLEPILRFHDRDRFEVYCYASVAEPDEWTHRYRELACHWRNVFGISDDAAARRIRRDRIDVLIDISGHFAGGRLGVFAQRAAPVQVSFSTYPATSGLIQSDYRVTDRDADPPGMTEHLYSERLIRLPRVYCCYQPPPEAPNVNQLPSLRENAVTFGCFNRPHKIHEGTLALWASILKAIPNSRLLFHYVFDRYGVVPSELREHITRQFGLNGVDPARAAFVGGLPLAAHLELFHQVDISLDTFPYNGMTTTCESLWMGVPPVTLAGRSHVSRVGVSLLTAVGLTDWIAESPREYTRIAVRMARNPELLSRLRAQLRSRMRRSPLTRAATYTRHLERAYRSMSEEAMRDAPKVSDR